MIVTERTMKDNVSVVVPPADYVPVISTALPMTIGELCACNEAIDSHFKRLDKMASIVEDYEEEMW